MTEYFERPFSQRFAQLGDTAEDAFVGINPRAHRLGLCRPALNMAKMHPRLRYTPDFLTEDGAYEVMGFSSKGNGTLKLKFEKADALRAWDMLIPTFLWVFDSGRKRYWCAPIDTWLARCYEAGERQFFPDNQRPYWNLHHTDFPSTPVSLSVVA